MARRRRRNPVDESEDPFEVQVEAFLTERGYDVFDVECGTLIGTEAGQTCSVTFEDGSKILLGEEYGGKWSGIRYDTDGLTVLASVGVGALDEDIRAGKRLTYGVKPRHETWEALLLYLLEFPVRGGPQEPTKGFAGDITIPEEWLLDFAAATDEGSLRRGPGVGLTERTGVVRRRSRRAEREAEEDPEVEEEREQFIESIVEPGLRRRRRKPLPKGLPDVPPEDIFPGWGEENPRRRRKKTPEWKRLIEQSRRHWERYDEKPLKRNLFAFGAHLERMKASGSARVKAERARALRAFRREMKLHGWKMPKQKIPGGRAALLRAKEFDQAQLTMGTKVELEHTDDVGIAREIAMDHLAEDPRYYIELAKMEERLERTRNPGGTGRSFRETDLEAEIAFELDALKVPYERIKEVKQRYYFNRRRYPEFYVEPMPGEQLLVVVEDRFGTTSNFFTLEHARLGTLWNWVRGGTSTGEWTPQGGGGGYKTLDEALYDAYSDVAIINPKRRRRR
jgi:hypothetical protein